MSPFDRTLHSNHAVATILKWTMATVLSLLATTALSEPFVVSYKGCVASEKTIQVIDKISLFELLENAELTECAFLFGASVTQTNRLPMQQQIKIKLLDRLEALLQSADTRASVEYFKKLQVLVKSQPVTGRILNIDLEPFHVEMQPLKNRVLTSEAVLYVPKRPNHLNLIGFEVDSIAYNSSLDLTSLLGAYPICDSCEPGWVWIMQPNTSIEKVKVGLWTNEKHYAAPGAWVISPLPNGYFNGSAEAFYKLLTTWLATQELK